LYDSGDQPAAESAARTVLAAEPANRHVLEIMARLAESRGDPQSALQYWTQAVLLCGDSAAWNGLGLSRLACGQVDSAAQAFEQAVRHDPLSVQALHNLARTYLLRGDTQRYEACLWEVIRIQPDCAPARENLGDLFRQWGYYAEAATQYEAALRANPFSADAATGLGLALHEDGDVDRAMECYRRALMIAPGHADASNNLATAHKEKGQLEAALAQFRITLQLFPNHPHAILNLSQLAAEGLYRFAPEELAGIRQIVAEQRGTPLDRCQLCFALAAVHGAERQDDEAFSYYRQGNELRKQATRKGTEYDPDRHDAFVERVITLFDAEYFASVRGWGAPRHAPIFLVGMPRTGSTVLEQILATDPQVYAGGERNELQRLLAHLYPGPDISALYQKKQPLTLAQDAGAAAEQILAAWKTTSKGAPIITIKTLENFPHLGLIATLFPNAKIIHCQRDVLDTCVSCYFQNFSFAEFSRDLTHIGRHYLSYERLAEHWDAVLPIPIHTVSYEALIREPERVTRELFDYCELPWQPGCLRFFENRGAVRTASTIQVRKPLSTRQIGRWQRYRAHLGPLLAALGPDRTGGA
jgi:tetratricopeptide (TPR) repeat protein